MERQRILRYLPENYQLAAVDERGVMAAMLAIMEAMHAPVDRVRTLALDEAVDEVRSKFGSGLLTRGVLLGRDSGIEMPLLPND